MYMYINVHEMIKHYVIQDKRPQEQSNKLLSGRFIGVGVLKRKTRSSITDFRSKVSGAL